MKKISTRIEQLEAQLIGPMAHLVCFECGAEGGGQDIIEEHHANGSVAHEPHPPCPGCEAVAASLGRVSRVVIHLGDECPVCEH